MAQFLVEWAVRSPSDKVFDPGAGEGVFLTEASKRLLQLGATQEQAANQVHGVELDQKDWHQVTSSVREILAHKPSGIVRGDFFDAVPANQESLFTDGLRIPVVDAVVGNPPYIRYQMFSGQLRQKALRKAQQAGVRLGELTSSWAPYLIHAAQFLNKGGRLGMVIPAKLLHVQYAKEVRHWLSDTFRSVRIVVFNKRVFPGALEDTVLLLGEKDGESTGFELVRLNDLNDLARLAKIDLERSRQLVSANGESWSKYLLSPEQYEAYEGITAKDGVVLFRSLATIDIGAVTGFNNYFLLSEKEVANWHIEKRFLKPVVSKAYQIRGLELTNGDWKELCRRGRKCLLFYTTLPPEKMGGTRAWAYIRYGEKIGADSRFKTRTRSPWYEVPGVRVPDAFLTYMSYDSPRLVLNMADTTSTNTIHVIDFRHRVNRQAFVTGFYNTLTFLSSELVGRSYGGGVHKLEPTEAESLVIVYPTEPQLRRRLAGLFHRVDRLLRDGRVPEVLNTVDTLLLKEYLGISDADYRKLKEAYRSLKGRRLAKKGEPTSV